MDPFTAIGLAGNIITFIDFSFEIVSIAREMHSSTTGATSGNKDLEFLTDKCTRLVLNLQCEKLTSLMTEDERNLNSLAIECARLSLELQEMLQDLKARKTGSKKSALQAVFRNIRKKKEKSKLEAKLEKCRRQLHLHLASTARLAIKYTSTLDEKLTSILDQRLSSGSIKS
jgi:hypothetical protein